ncbi:MarR family transcriptional regulator (plasmid) [Halolamina sp. CBA1230]|uniref:MarR family transcriptional regulator n=1 Tax=Halolamina sp. CBA1230 TaxID=1853690 RepID=UPI0009A13A6E|nr:MarR family transcriptional regulator [Halolamina sp. CBA1230]QKY21973.1 MarR family transcriptional regulator [Halolamina sp. CBA1230]
MPISADRFESIDDEEGPTPGTNAHEILSFLEVHADEAFTQSEIAEATGINRGSVGPTLSRLHTDGRVDHKGIYWRISDHARSVDAAASHANEAAASREDEPMAYDEWQEHAVDPRNDRE